MRIGNQSRFGSALVVTMIIIMTIAGMAVTLTNLSISRYKEQKYRQLDVDLLAASESAANEAVAWMRQALINPEMAKYLADMPTSNGDVFPETTITTDAVLVSTDMPSGFPAMYPALGVGTPGGVVSSGGSGFSGTAVAANTADRRNACQIVTKITKITTDATPSKFTDLSPNVPSVYFKIYTTAQYGDETSADFLRRLRVEAIVAANGRSEDRTEITTVPTPGYPFTRGLFALNGYDFKGTATTDSWDSDLDNDGIADNPYVQPDTYVYGGPNTQGDVGSNGVLGSGAYDWDKVHGTATADAGAQLPNVIYDPPTTGVNYITPVAGDVTLNGTSDGNTIYQTSSVNMKNNDTLTISGSGTVILYVDAEFNVGDVVFDPMSTANLVIFQNDVDGKGCSFNAQNTIGDKNDPSRFIFATAFSGTGPQEMTLNGGAEFSAVVLAPYAGIKFTGGSDFYGSFVGKDFSGAVNGNFSFHYDESLGDLSFGTIYKDIESTKVVWYLNDFTPKGWDIKTVGNVVK